MRSNLARRAFQLIVRQQTKGLEVFTIGDTGEVLPVFGFEDEAEMFLRLGLPEQEGWQVRETTCGELVSVLHGPCREIEHVSLDPVPRMVGLEAVGFATLSREHFISVLLSESTPPPAEMVGVS